MRPSLAALLSGRMTRVLIADDDWSSRALLRTILEREGCAVVEADSGASALADVTSQPPDLLLLDVQMPAPDGIQLTRQLRRRYSEAELPIILVTGYGEVEVKVAGLDAGATDFVTKPYEPAELVARVRAALRTRAALERLESAQGVIAALASAVEAKDPSTEHHCSRLAELALGLARQAAIDGEQLEAIGYGAVLHDVGKIGVPEAVIRKTGGLDAEEWAAMRQHPAIGAGIVEPLRLGRLVAPIVRGHHERWDGGGYPDGLRGTQIPIGARVVTIVDAYDAMIHDRPYRAALSLDQAQAELRAEAGRQFDPELTAVFLEHVDAGAVPEQTIDSGGLLAAFTRGLVEEPVS